MTIPTIVVGIDGEPASHSALRVAIDEAVLRRGRVLAIACWALDERYLPWRPDGNESDTRIKAELLIQQAITAVAADPHELSLIVRESSQGEPGPGLVSASRTASFLVIGSTTRGPVARAAGKTVVDYCLRFSDVPVIVVPFTASGFDDLDIEGELRHTSGYSPVDIPLRYDPCDTADR